MVGDLVMGGCRKVPKYSFVKNVLAHKVIGQYPRSIKLSPKEMPNRNLDNLHMRTPPHQQRLSSSPRSVVMELSTKRGRVMRGERIAVGYDACCEDGVTDLEDGPC